MRMLFAMTACRKFCTIWTGSFRRVIQSSSRRLILCILKSSRATDREVGNRAGSSIHPCGIRVVNNEVKRRNAVDKQSFGSGSLHDKEKKCHDYSLEIRAANMKIQGTMQDFLAGCPGKATRDRADYTEFQATDG